MDVWRAGARGETRHSPSKRDSCGAIVIARAISVALFCEVLLSRECSASVERCDVFADVFAECLLYVHMCRFG